MDVNSTEKIQNNEAEPGIGYQVFYSDSEEIAKMLAVGYITENMHREEKPVERPEIPFSSYFIGLILPAALYAVVTVLALLLSKTIGVWPCVAAYVIVFLCTVKRSVIHFVLMYQKFAPERIRRSCCFEPTCSNYMLQAIEKYGFWIGFFKGVGRLCRCHYPNGGEDLP